MEKVNDWQAYLPLMSICAPVSVKHLHFGESTIKEIGTLFSGYHFDILPFCQSRLLVSQHVAEDCAVLAAVSLCLNQ